MRLVRYPDLRAKGLCWSRMHLNRLEKAGKFPKRIQLGTGTVVWLEAEIDAWLEARIAARDTSPGVPEPAKDAA